MLNDLKKILGLNNTEFDTIVTNLMNSAIADMKSVGIAESKVVDTDPLIRTAIITYVKAHFDESKRESLQESYDMQKDKLRKTSEYLEPVAPETEV